MYIDNPAYIAVCDTPDTSGPHSIPDTPDAN